MDNDSAARWPASAVVVVGAGIAGVACARALGDAGVTAVVLERSRVVGGRLATRRFDGRPTDTGASYFTARDPRFEAVVADWVERGVARGWTRRFDTVTDVGTGPGQRQAGHDGPLRYVGVDGQRSVVADLARGLDIRSGVTVGSVSEGPAVDGRPARAVAVCMPDPQALRLLDASLPAEREVLEGRPWESVLALLARWPQRCWELADGAFVHDSPVLSFVADDGARRGDGAPVLVAHSTPEFADAHLGEPPAAGAALLAELRRLLGIAEEPAETLVHRWMFAKPVGQRAATHHLGEHLVGLAGDGFGASKVEAAWLSGTELGESLARQLTGARPHPAASR